MENTQNNIQQAVQSIPILVEEEARASIAALHAYVQSVNELTREYGELLDAEAEALSEIGTEEGRAKDELKATALRIELESGT